MHNETHMSDHSESGALISADRVKGTNVYDTEGEKIGSIDSVMLSKHGGKVAYAVMSFGGFLGIGEKYHPLPWNKLDYDTELNGYRVSMTGESLRDAPSYDRDALERDEWGSTADDYYRGAGGQAAQAGGASQYPPANRI